MKKLLFISIPFFCLLQLPAQKLNRVCFRDTTFIEMQISHSDTNYVVKPQFNNGNWILFYDLKLSKKRSDFHFDSLGNKTGIWTEWYESGNVKSEWNYSKAWLVAFPTGHFLFPDGTTKISREVRNDSLVETNYFPSGKISHIRKWLRSGYMVLESTWCENGQLIVSYNPTASTPLPVKKYHCNGKLKAEYNWYVYGYTGPYSEYFENGFFSIKGQFENRPSGPNNFIAKKIGDWVYFDEKGKVVKTEHWDAGRLLKTE